MRRRIVLLVVGMTVLVVLCFAVPVGILLRSAVAQRAEQATTDQAESVALFLRSSPSDAAITSYVQSAASGSGRPTSVTTPDGMTIGDFPLGTPTVPHPGGPPNGNSGDGGGPEPQPNATLQSAPGGQVAEVSVRAGSGQYFVRVFLSDKELHAGEGKWWLLLGGGSLGLIVLGVVLAELLTRRLVRPLNRTTAAAQQLAEGDTDARAPTDGPREVAAVGTALNSLAGRIDELIAEERETIADLSHRLRTPLTALRLDAEALRDPDEAERVGTHVSTLERMLTSLIHTARRTEREGRMPSADASAVVRERLEFWAPLADDQGRAAAQIVPESPCVVRASAEDLAAALDALLENVFAHTPDGTAYTVRLIATGDGYDLEVEDAGPGFVADLQERGRSDRGSTGLGLDIARRTAERSGGSLTVSRGAAGGACVALHLGRA